MSFISMNKEKITSLRKQIFLGHPNYLIFHLFSSFSNSTIRYFNYKICQVNLKQAHVSKRAMPDLNIVFIQSGFPGGSVGKESACQCTRRRFDPWFRKIPWRGKWQPTPVLLPGKSHGQRRLVGYRPWGLAKESDKLSN